MKTFTVLLHFNYTWNRSEELFNALEHEFSLILASSAFTTPNTVDPQQFHSTFAVINWRTFKRG